MLNRNSGTPLYQQIKNTILGDIKDLKKDSRICSEREYAEKYKVSRITVRRAIEELVREKYLIRITGKGTFVTNIDHSSEFTSIVSFTNDMEKKGYNVFSKILKFEIMPPSDEIAKKLKITRNDKIFWLKRLRFANNIPVALQSSYIIYNYCPSLPDYDLCSNSLYDTLEHIFNLKLLYAKNTLEVKLANKEESKLFELEKINPVFEINQVTILENGKPIEYVKSIYRGDKYKFFNITRGN